MNNLKELTDSDIVYGREFKYYVTMKEFLESSAKIAEIVNYHGLKPGSFYGGLRRYIINHGMSGKASTSLVRTDHGSVVYLKRVDNSQ